MDIDKLKKEILPCLEKAIKFSFSNNLDLHTSIGGKYAELFVAAELWKHEPKLAGERKEVKDVKNPRSCDIVLAKTKKNLRLNGERYIIVRMTRLLNIQKEYLSGAGVFQVENSLLVKNSTIAY